MRLVQYGHVPANAVLDVLILYHSQMSRQSTCLRPVAPQRIAEIEIFGAVPRKTNWSISVENERNVNKSDGEMLQDLLRSPAEDSPGLVTTSWTPP